MYSLLLVDSSEDVYAITEVPETLKIKTHYESLDIAQSKKIFYLKFQLPDVIPNLDQELQQFLKETEPVQI